MTDNNNNFFSLKNNILSINKVNNIDEMINHDNIYILSSDNFIYYYNNN